MYSECCARRHHAPCRSLPFRFRAILDREGIDALDLDDDRTSGRAGGRLFDVRSGALRAITVRAENARSRVLAGPRDSGRHFVSKCSHCACSVSHERGPNARSYVKSPPPPPFEYGSSFFFFVVSWTHRSSIKLLSSDRWVASEFFSLRRQDRGLDFHPAIVEQTVL